MEGRRKRKEGGRVENEGEQKNIHTTATIILRLVHVLLSVYTLLSSLV